MTLTLDERIDIYWVVYQALGCARDESLQNAAMRVVLHLQQTQGPVAPRHRWKVAHAVLKPGDPWRNLKRAAKIARRLEQKS